MQLGFRAQVPCSWRTNVRPPAHATDELGLTAQELVGTAPSLGEDHRHLLAAEGQKKPFSESEGAFVAASAGRRKGPIGRKTIKENTV